MSRHVHKVQELRTLSQFLSCVQVLIRWAIQNGTSVIPKATGVSHIQGNLDALNFELSQEEVQVSTHIWSTPCLLPMLWPSARLVRGTDLLCTACAKLYACMAVPAFYR